MSHAATRLTQSATQTTSLSKRIVAGRIISAVPILFMIFDGGIKLTKVAPVTEAFIQLGYPVSLAPTIGILALVCTAVYALPRSSVLGAVLLTGYLGGAIATQVRAGAGLFPIFFPLIIAGLIWGGLFLRDDRLRAFLPLRSARAVQR
jgi:hypothetical protein